MSYQDTRWSGGVTPLQRCCRCILQLQPIRQPVQINKWVITGIRGRYEIICTRPTADTESLAEVNLSLAKEFRSVTETGHQTPGWATVNRGPWPGSQKMQRYKALKITQCGMVKRSSYRSTWQSVFFSLRLLCLSHTYAIYEPFREMKCENYIFIKKSVIVILPLCLFILHLFIMPLWCTTIREDFLFCWFCEIIIA